MRQVAETTEGRFYYAPNNRIRQGAYTDIAHKSHIRLTSGPLRYCLLFQDR